MVMHFIVIVTTFCFSISFIITDGQLINVSCSVIDILFVL